MNHQSKIILLGMVTEVVGFKENPLNVYTIKVKCINKTSETTTFYVDTGNPVLRTKLKSYKPNDIVLLEGDFLFDRIILEQVNRISSHKKAKDALSTLLSFDFSNQVYIKGDRKEADLTVVLDESVPMNGFIDTSYTFRLQDEYDEKFKRKKEIILIGTYVGDQFKTQSISTVV